jgi:hypothetical protein
MPAANPSPGALDIQLLQSLMDGTAEEAWRLIGARVLELASRPLTENNAASEILQRDRQIGALDHFLAASGWDLWQGFGGSVERTSDRLARWWREPYTAKAVLILDGLSLRELPWLLQGASARGYTLHDVSAHASELPGKTSEFARALGFSSRAQLQNDGGGLSHRLQPARTECVGLPWKDCAGLIDGTLNWIFWHPWPDSQIHDGAGAGQGLDTLTRNVAEQLSSDDFWAFVERLATGRRLVITSDHGYAATGYYPDTDGEPGQFLKQTFGSGRVTPGIGDTGPFVPPVALGIDSPHGPHLLALGRRKWKSQGGYPTLTHGGLSLLEVFSPFVEITR